MKNFFQAICFVFIVAFISAFWGYNLFRKINREPSLREGGIGGQMEVLKKERIEKVLQYFSLREQKSNQILNSPSPVIDPSL